MVDRTCYVVADGGGLFCAMIHLEIPYFDMVLESDLKSKGLNNLAGLPMVSLSHLKLKHEKEILGNDLFEAYCTGKEILACEKDIETLYLQAKVCAYMGKLNESLEMLLEYTNSNGQLSEAWLLLGQVLKQNKDFGSAENKIREFISLSPNRQLIGYWHLSNLKYSKLTSKDLKAIERLASSKSLDDLMRVPLNFLRGKIHEENSDYQRACEAIQSSKKYLGSIEQINQNQIEKLTKHLLEIKKIPWHHTTGNTIQPIFILGLPKSGVMIVSQLLSSQSKIESTNFSSIKYFYSSVLGNKSYEGAIPGVYENERKAIRDLYFNHCLNSASTDSFHFVDASPDNFLYIALIIIIFPNAKFVCTYRNTLDHAIDLYRQYFVSGHEYTYSFASIASYMESYYSIVKHWESLSENNFFYCDYQTLLKDTESIAQKISEFCHLPYEKLPHDFQQVEFYPDLQSDQSSTELSVDLIRTWQEYIPLNILKKLNHLDIKFKRGFNRLSCEATAVWSDYWSKGGISSFAGANYEGNFRAHWIDIAKEIESNTAILDLCTGNGALLDIINKTKPSRFTPTLVGVDSAEPQSYGKPYDIIGNINIEQLPFRDREFSVVISQFGIEYSNIELSSKELGRVLIPGGKFKFICHCHDSVVVENNRLIHQCSEMLLNDTFPLFVKMLQGLDLISIGDSRGEVIASSSREKFNASIAEVHNKYNDALFDSGFPDAMKKILSQKASGKTVEMFEAFVESFRAAQTRLTHLFKAAMHDDTLIEFRSFLELNGLEVTRIEKIYESKIGILGWVIEGRRC